MRKTGAIIPAREEEPPAAPIDLRKLFPFLCYGLIAPWNIGISVAKFNRGKKTRTKYSLESPDDMERFLEKTYIERLNSVPLSVKLVVGVSAILIVVMGLFTSYDMRTRTRFHLEQQQQWAHTLSDTVMRSIEYSMFDGKMDDVQAILERLYTLKGIKVVNLCDETGTIKYSGLPVNRGTTCSLRLTKQALEMGAVMKGLEMFRQEKVLYYAMPIPNENTCFRCHGSTKKILGSLTVGISWSPIEKRIASLRNREIIFVIFSLLVVGFFLILFLSRYITRPLTQLTKLADDVSRGNPGKDFGRLVKCWEVENCEKRDCPAYENIEIMCWYVDGTLCQVQPSGSFPEKLDMCRKCKVFRTNAGDEMVQLADSFKHMLYRLRKSEEDLRQSEEKYRLLFDTEPNPIFILEPKTLKILDANARAESQYGYGKEELLKMTFVDLEHEGGTQEIMSAFDGVMDGRCVLFPKKRHHRKDHSLFFANVHICSARYVGKEALIATTTDITETVMKEVQLIQASKLATLGEMATGIAHELNQPLNVIKIGSAFLLESIQEGKHVSEKDLTTIAKEFNGEVDRASGIINHLRNFARTGNISKETVFINEPIRGVFKVLAQQLKLREIEVELDLNENLPPIMADNNRLEQVFINLVTNARDALEEVSGRRKFLKIRSFMEGENVVVTVSDTGKGIPNGILNKIFEPFFTTKEVGKGTGLGLSISYGIIRDYGGAITVQSQEGKGTTFRLEFPPSRKAEQGS